jgi:oxygen-independent coproporphyrinogen-3 oxidase
MFGTPGQVSVDDDLARLLDMGLKHVSAYALTIEPGTQFGELYRKGRLQIATEDDYAAMFVAAEGRFAASGLEHYEVSNYAAVGEESRHNQHYWRGGSYVGLGAAAVGCLDEAAGRARRWRNHPVGEDYIAAAATGSFETESEDLDAPTLIREAFMLGLRTREGIDLDEVAARTRRDPRQGREEALHYRLESGDLIQEGSTLRVPPARWLHLDTIVAHLF